MDKTINFSTMSPDARQEFVDFLYKEFFRHKDDMDSILKDLRDAKRLYKLTPRRVYIDKRIEITGGE